MSAQRRIGRFRTRWPKVRELPPEETHRTTVAVVTRPSRPAGRPWAPDRTGASLVMLVAVLVALALRWLRGA